MICTTVFSLFLGCTEPAQQRQEYKTERSYNDNKQHNHRKHKQEHRRTHKASGRCGKASWYGKELSGRRTASGERFRPSGLTAASWHYGLGSRVTVVNPKNGRTVTVRINDRGPASWTGRLIDLSQGAFRKIAHPGKGVVKVCLSG